MKNTSDLENWTITFGQGKDKTRLNDNPGTGTAVTDEKFSAKEAAEIIDTEVKQQNEVSPAAVSEAPVLGEAPVQTQQIINDPNEIITNANLDTVDEMYDRYEDPEDFNFEGRPAEDFGKTVTVLEQGKPVTFGEVDGVFYRTLQPIIEPVVTAADWLLSNRPAMQKGLAKGAVKGGQNLNDAVSDLIGLPGRYGSQYAAEITNKLLGTDLTGNSENYLKTGLNDFIDWVGEYIPFNDSAKAVISQKTSSPEIEKVFEVISQYGIVAVPAASIVKGLTSANALARGYMWAALADGLSTDKTNTTIAQDLGLTKYFEEQASPEEKNALIGIIKDAGNLYFQNNPDTEGANRFRLALEGVMLGKGVEALFTHLPRFIKWMPWKKAFSALAVAASAVPNDAEGSPISMVSKYVLGLIGNPAKVAGNLKRLETRQQNLVEKGKPLPGAPNLRRIVMKAPNAKLPDFVVGDLSFDDWIKRTEKILNSKEIVETSRFYEDTRAIFLKHAGGDQELANKYMTAWLVANQNTTPIGAFQNVLLQAEQFARSVPKEQMKAGGLPSPTGAARNVVAGEPIDKGVGQKIFDFVDSGYKKPVRAWMDNNPAGGKPFVVDIHTARDTGLVDKTLINHLKRLGYDTKELDKAQKGKPFDFGDSVNETKYENRADFGRRLTDHLNDVGWQGRKDWEPREIQAVGWGALTKLTQSVAPNVDEALTQSLRRISYEIDPGAGSPWASKFGDRWNKLPLERRATITQTVGSRAMEMAAKASGIDVRRVVHATGGWTDEGVSGQAAAAVAETYTSKQGAELAANYLGYLTNQKEVWVNTIKNATKAPKGFAIDLMEEGTRTLDSNEAVLKFWNEIVASDKSKLFGGYQMIRGTNGEPVMRILVRKQPKIAGEKTRAQIDSVIANDINSMLGKQKFDVKISLRDADIVVTGNDWKKVKDGQGYKSRVAEIGGRGTAGNLDSDGAELTKFLDGEIGKAESGTKGRRSRTGKIKPPDE